MLFSIIIVAIFLTINNPHSTLASPIIFNGISPATQPRNLTHLLAKRYVPSDSRCGTATWVSRRCLPLISDRTWQDECLITIGNHQVTSLVVSLCPENTICMNDVIENRLTSLCIPRPAANPDPNTPQTQQTGYLPVQVVTTPTETKVVSVTLGKSITSACVSAILEGSDADYVIAANAPITATLRGGPANLCYYNVTNRDCVPTAQYSFEAGAIVDFTFGLTISQTARFYYAIIGNS